MLLKGLWVSALWKEENLKLSFDSVNRFLFIFPPVQHISHPLISKVPLCIWNETDLVFMSYSNSEIFFLISYKETSSVFQFGT